VTEEPSVLPEDLLESLMDVIAVNSPPYLQIYCGTLIVHSAGKEVWFGQFVRKCMKRYFSSKIQAQLIPQERFLICISLFKEQIIQEHRRL